MRMPESDCIQALRQALRHYAQAHSGTTGTLLTFDITFVSLPQFYLVWSK